MLYFILKSHFCDIILNVHVPTESQKGGKNLTWIDLGINVWIILKYSERNKL